MSARWPYRHVVSLLVVAAWLVAAPVPVATQMAPAASAAAESRSPAGAAAADFSIADVLEVRGASVHDLSADGQWAVISYTSQRDRIGIDNHRFGDPTYVAPVLSEVRVMDTRTGQETPLFPVKRQIRGAAWSPDAALLALVVREGDDFRLALWERARSRLRMVSLPRGRILADNTALRWSDDGSRLFFATRTQSWRQEAAERFRHEVHGPIVVRSSDEPFLSWDEVRRLGLRQGVAVYQVRSGRVEELAPESMLGGWAVTDDGAWLRLHDDITEGTSYEQIFGRENRIRAVRLDTGDERVILDSDRGLTLRWSGDGRAWAFARDGKLLFGDLELDEPRTLAEPEPASPDTVAAEGEEGAADDRNRREERFSPVRLSHDGSLLVASNRRGLWLFDTATGEREQIVEQDPDDDEAPRWAVAEWSRDGQRIYLTYASRTEWDRGVYRYDRPTGQLTELTRGTRQLSGLRLSGDGETMLLNVADGARPADIHTADPDLSNMRRLTDTNPWLAERRLGDVELIDYLDADGRKLYGVLHYPADYQPGQRYPTVFIVYESYFDERFNSTVALLNANGYAVMQPSVHLERGYPGEGWLKGVTAAANRIIAMGVADPDRLGVHGTSYGGYATNLLIAQTSRFKAAINISGKTNMVSFYTDSPRLGTRNIHAPERSQDRIGGTLWEQPHKYLAHSAVMMADRIRTPLLLMTGQQDHNVTERTTSEMYYALRRLGRDVEWVSYIDGGHGMPRSTVEEAIDYHERILAWYDRYLKTDEEPGG